MSETRKVAPKRRGRMEDGKLHYVNNLARHPESGVYLYRFSFKGRVKTGSTGCYRLSEARDYVNALKGKLSLEGVGIRRKKVHTFRQAYEAWIAEIAPQKSKNYVDSMKTMLGNHVLPILGGFNVAEIDKTAFNTVTNKYTSTGRSVSSANNMIMQIKTILGFAVEKGWLVATPKVKRLEFQRKPKPILTEEDLDRFFEKIDSFGEPKISFLVRAQVYMGFRSDEAIHMKWSCVRKEQDVYTSYVADRTKNKQSPSMPIPTLMQPWFERMAKEHGTFGYICPNKDGKPHCRQFINFYMHKATSELGLPGTLTSHRLRATFANILNKRGVPINTLQKLMRHSRVETTMVYLEVREDELREAINKI